MKRIIIIIIIVIFTICRGMAPLGPIVAMSAGKKAALATFGMFTGVGGAVAFKLDQVSSYPPTSKY